MPDAELLKILCCPDTHQPLRPADAGLVQRLNDRIQAGQLKNVGGKTVTHPCDAGLLRQDGQVLYPIRQNIPILLVAEGIRISDVMRAV